MQTMSPGSSLRERVTFSLSLGCEMSNELLNFSWNEAKETSFIQYPNYDQTS